MTMAITRQDLVPLNTYRKGREEYLQKMLAYKQERRVRMDEHVSLLFENRNTVLFQIQELVNCEDLTDPNELDEYIDIYSGMLPQENELSATLFIEWDNQDKLAELLRKLQGIEHHLALKVGAETIQAVFEEEHNDRGFTTSVHYVKFPLTQTAKEHLLNSNEPQVTLILNHPELSAQAVLTPNCIRSLQKDLA